MNRFEFLPDQCPICKAYDIVEIDMEYYDFNGLVIETKKMCRSCHATFDKHATLDNIETVEAQQVYDA